MTARKRAAPKVGIFFVVDGKHPFVDRYPLQLRLAATPVGANPEAVAGSRALLSDSFLRHASAYATT
jgi:hypothetical protein